MLDHSRLYELVLAMYEIQIKLTISRSSPPYSVGDAALPPLLDEFPWLCISATKISKEIEKKTHFINVWLGIHSNTKHMLCIVCHSFVSFFKGENQTKYKNIAKP